MWGGTADVANPRPRKVGGACRRQVLAGARTQETVGGPNGAARSELRRTAPPDNKRYHDCQMLPKHVIDFRGWPRDMATRGILQSSGGDEFEQAGRRHGPLCNTLIIKYHLF